MNNTKKPEPEKWAFLLKELQKTLVNEFASEGKDGVAKRSTMEVDVNRGLLSLKETGKLSVDKYVALSSQQLCQLMDFLGRQDFRVHGDLVLVEQQVSVFAKISVLALPKVIKGGEPRLEVALYAHIDPVVKMAILYLISKADPEFKISAHPYTRPTAI